MTRYAVHRSALVGLGAFLSHVEAPDETAAKLAAAEKYRGLAVTVRPDPETRLAKAVRRLASRTSRGRAHFTTEES